MLIRRATAGDWAMAKAVRLEALREEPMAFASTYEREVAFSDQVWRDRIEAAAQFLALNGPVDDPRPIGTATGLTIDREPGVVHLVAMYVRSSARGRGVGAALVRSVVEHARVVGAECVRLFVVEANRTARRLYERAGFAPTGRTMALPHTPELSEIELELSTDRVSRIETVVDPE